MKGIKWNKEKLGENNVSNATYRSNKIRLKYRSNKIRLKFFLLVSRNRNWQEQLHQKL